VVYGGPALVFVHSYIGILIFVAFITVFWYFILKWLDGKEQEHKTEPARSLEAAPQQS